MTHPFLERGRTASLRAWWAAHRVILLRTLCVLLGVGAVQRLGDGFWRLLAEPPPLGAVDLFLRYTDVHLWFTGHPVYPERKSAVYPPASYAILWLPLGWLPFSPARWLWAATTVAALAWLIRLLLEASAAESRLERLFVALLPLSIYATRATLVNGQLMVHALPVLIAGLVLLDRGRRGWGRDFQGAALVLVGFVKLTVATPFGWLVVFAERSWRPALLLALGYATLTVFAASFQPFDLATVLRQWVTNAVPDAAHASREAHANLHTWLAGVGLQAWNPVASLLALGLLGWWTHRHRHVDLWLRLGVTALVTRFWSFHYRYDDVLVLLPMIALFRLAKRGHGRDGDDVGAGVMLGLVSVTMLAPARLFGAPWPWATLFEMGQTTVWLAALGYLLHRARRERAPAAVRRVPVTPSADLGAGGR